MRYLIAMLTAIIFAALATMFLSSPIANWVVRQYTFDSPDTVAALHAATFMVCNVAALVFGFIVGWGLGRRWREQ
jgi:ABC-type sulfate transport system permease component